MQKNKKKSHLIIYIVVAIVAYSLINSLIADLRPDDDIDNYEYDKNTFSIISSSDNKDIGESIAKYADKKGYKISVTYLDTLEVVDTLNSGKKYDAVLVSNSLWLRMLDSNVVKTSSLRSTSISPIIFGIKKSKAESLGFVNKDVYTKDILDKINSGELSFSMGNPMTTNSGVSAYLEILSNLAGNPEVLKSEHLKSQALKNQLKEFFKGIKRTSGDEDFLETSFINGDYDAAFTSESSIIKINKQLEKDGKETLYAIYPVDGVAISDIPFVYIDNKSEYKKDVFESIQEFLLSGDGQKQLLESGRRTWYGGTTNNAPKDVFNSKWGINTTKYITPIKYPSIAVINEALALYQSELRKPVHVVFCLDYSGSMYGSGMEELVNAMEYVLTGNDISVSFSEHDKIDVVPFGSYVLDTWSTTSGLTNEDLLNKIKNKDLDGATALYAAASKGLELLNKENDDYVSSIILMTDGMANVGYFSDLQNYYKKVNKDIPIYSITFGNADDSQLKEIAELTNGKVFNGRNGLVQAFKKVRGYN